MYLKSLEMLGFKSFAEARIEFPNGVTAIVGPNGSGKSNVVDAILWVLGEQSTKTLRSEKMEDVIFNGTEVRKPLGMAEVSLVISGLDQVKVEGQSGLPSQLAEYQDLMITRRLYRNGDSEYLINKTLCRLKDIRSILLDTRAGTKGHTVIAQGQIDQILNASPHDRRELIEETAGIVRYKKQKAEALRKLEVTQQNLLRVRDIIAEVKKQLNSLERQARQARSYQVLQEEARTLEVQLLTNEYRRLRGMIAELERELDTLSRQESEQAAEQARFTAELERIKLAITDAGIEIGQRRDELSQIEQQQAQTLTTAEVERNKGELYEQQQAQGGEELERLTREQEHLKEAEAALLTELDRLDQTLTEREQALAALDREMKGLVHQRAVALQEEERGRMDVLNLAVLVANTEQSLSQLTLRAQEVSERDGRLAREREEIQAQHDAAMDKRQALHQACQAAEQIAADLRRQQQQIEESSEKTGSGLTEVEQLLATQSEDLAAVDSHLRALQGVLREDMGYGRSGDEEATALKTCQGVHDAVAEWLVVPAGLDRAVEAILGERVRGWFVDGPQAASHAIAFLMGKDLGRGTFIPQAPRWNVSARPNEWWSAVAGRPGVIGRAVDLIEVEERRSAMRDYLFDGVVFIETLSEAISLWEQQAWSAPDGPTFVTRAGEVLDAAGIVTGGQVSSTGGLLQRRREVMQLESRRTALAEQVEQARQQRERLQAEAQWLREEGRRVAEALRDEEMKALSLQKDAAGLQHFLGDLSQRIETLMGDAQRGSLEVQRLEQEARSGQAQLSQWIAEKTGQEGALQAVRARVEQMDQGMQGLQQRLTQAQMAAQEARTTREHRQSDLQRIRQEQQEAVGRIDSLNRQLEALGASLEQSRLEQERQEARCREFGQSAERVKAQLVEAQERQAQDMARAQSTETSLEHVRKTVFTLRESRMTLEVKRAEVRTQLGTVESTLSGTYQVDPASLVESDAADLSTSEVRDGASTHDTQLLPTEDELRQQLHKIRERLDRMGPINLAAISEHQELDERHRFLSAQEQDLSNSIASLKEIIQRINRTTKDMFATTFAELQEKFGEVFGKFFPGGRAELQLVEVPLDDTVENRGPQEPGVEIVAQPPGKRLKSITMLSGGEKTLTAMALLFASFLIRPTPFCILDEIDAPLDEENIGRFTGVLCELSQGAQFMVITHNKRTMGIADSLFGVTMEEPGISKLVSVRLNDMQPA
ncbi:MAG TPA: chromosome segregation protein SMC [Nitrospira sp.]|nr:chromosome segregation protein SMC [Nitrospira sp.]